ncbi:nicotinate phosphoribosyltransferase-like [Anneissia japonica]|uniref:nicotinate phosphoribosyltransferase-like n=1 Tax=Anneissia japonica TaxID=1529436 RepID=UPI001425807C|nr:nicotinate phosphoribosyltransferase-like [Anneissia japonica]
MENSPELLSSSDVPNGVVQPLLTDLYQITMAYAYWKGEKRNAVAVFDLYFRRSPFAGEFTIFAGLGDCLKYLQKFKFSESDITYLKSVLPSTTEPEFFEYLQNLDASKITLYAIPEGTVVFPRIPLLRVEGPLPVAQLLETTLLTLINYASLVATNAARFKLAAGEEKSLLEFGLRRAQGPDGGLTASKYCYLGGFDGTSNVLAGKLYGIPVRGTHAHAFVSSFTSFDELSEIDLKPTNENGEKKDFIALCKKWLSQVARHLEIVEEQTNSSELAAFISYASAFPTGFLALVDTYDVFKSGIPNFCTVALALNELGYRSIGIRLDSGDLAYQSKRIRSIFKSIGKMFKVPWFEDVTIVASNDINEDTLHSLNEQVHEIDSFGIGTHLVTCQRQPALGCVYKLVEVDGKPRIKLSHEVEKVTIPGRKQVFRLYSHDGKALIDLLQRVSEPAPEENKRVLCRHPFSESKRAYVNPSRVEKLHVVFWKDGKIAKPLRSLQEVRADTIASIKSLRDDHKRALNPTPYKVSVTDDLYRFLHKLWLDNAPIGELS